MTHKIRGESIFILPLWLGTRKGIGHLVSELTFKHHLDVWKLYLKKKTHSVLPSQIQNVELGMQNISASKSEMADVSHFLTYWYQLNWASINN